MSAKAELLGDYGEMLGGPTVDSLSAWQYLSVIWERATTVEMPVVSHETASSLSGPQVSGEPLNYFRNFASSMIAQGRKRPGARNPYWVGTK